MSKNLLQLPKFVVSTTAGIETIRTSQKAAEEDVKILKDICRKHAWIGERND